MQDHEKRAEEIMEIARTRWGSDIIYVPPLKDEPILVEDESKPNIVLFIVLLVILFGLCMWFVYKI